MRDLFQRKIQLEEFLYELQKKKDKLIDPNEISDINKQILKLEYQIQDIDCLIDNNN